MNDLITLGGVEIGNLILPGADDKEVSTRPTGKNIFPATPVKDVVALSTTQNIALAVPKNLVMFT